MTDVQTDPIGFEEFRDAYVECMLWAGTDDGAPLDESYDAGDLSVEALSEINEECAGFLRDNSGDIGEEFERAGHDFYLTRNGHGAGFWDGGWPEDAGRRLTDAAKVWGSSDAYVGDDGTLYVAG